MPAGMRKRLSGLTTLFLPTACFIDAFYPLRQSRDRRPPKVSVSIADSEYVGDGEVATGGTGWLREGLPGVVMALRVVSTARLP
jgi:hypothetical protein